TELLEELEDADETPALSEDESVESLMVEIRPESEQDHDVVREILNAAFEGEEARLVELLRQNGHAVIELVATTGEETVGYIVFSPVNVSRCPKGFKAAGLGPVAVHPDFQGNGIGSKLIQDGLAACKSAGFGVVVVLGNPDFYQRFGFAKASRFHLTNTF